MASVLKVDSLQELTANAGIHIVGKITGPSGDLITADGRLSVTRQNINVTEDLTANKVIGTQYVGFKLNMIENLLNADSAGINQVLTTDGSGNFFFANPIEAGAIGYTTDAIDNIIDGGGPGVVYLAELGTIDGGGVVQDG